MTLRSLTVFGRALHGGGALRRGWANLPAPLLPIPGYRGEGTRLRYPRTSGHSAYAHKTTFSSTYALPNFRHSFMAVRRIDERPWNETKWDIPAVWRRDRERPLMTEPAIARMTTI